MQHEPGDLTWPQMPRGIQVKERSRRRLCGWPKKHINVHAIRPYVVEWRQNRTISDAGHCRAMGAI
jgi:hypothetical protein